jgi:hypothetical protein
MPVSVADLRTFLRQERYAVQSSRSLHGVQAAVVGIAVSESFEIFFDTVGTTRKAVNLRRDPAVALVVGSTSAEASSTLQIEGLADEPEGVELERLLNLYLAKFPDGRGRRGLPDLTYFRIRPTWMRWSNFATDPPEIVEFTAADISAGFQTLG